MILKNFEKVKVTELDGIYNKFNQILSSQCTWCNCYATDLVTRTSTVTDLTYHDRACPVCADYWRNYESDPNAH